MKTATFTITRPDTGAVLPLARVTVFNADGVTRATIFNADGTAQGNPITASNNGAITIAGADATYVLQAVSSDGTYSVPPITVDLYDLPAIQATCLTYANLAITAGSTGNPYSNAYASTLPKGVTSGILGGTAITGATPGTYALTAVGGSITGVQANLVVLTATTARIDIVNTGLGAGTTPPTWANPSGATLPAGTTLTAVVSTLIADQKSYWAASADGSQILQYGNNGGSVATYPFGGTQTVMYAKAGVDASVVLYTTGNVVGEDRVDNYTLPLVVNDNLVGGLARTGEWNVPAVKVKMQAVTGEDVGTGFKSLVSADGLTGVFLMGYNANGELDFKPSPELIARFGVSGFLPVTSLRGTWDSSVYNVRRGASHFIAGVRDRSRRSFDARQLITGAQSTLVADDASNPIDMILVMGQSNAGEGGASGVLFSTAAYPFTVHQSAGLANGAAYGTAAISASAYADLIGAADVAGAAGVRGQFPAKMIGFALQHYNALTGRRESGVIAGTAWEGSQPLASFFPATASHYNYENAVEIVKAAKAAAALYGRTIRVTLVFIQGEAGPTGQATYGNLLGNAGGNLLDAILPGLQTAAGMAAAPKVVLVQTNVLQGASENYACMGQYDVAVARADTVLAGPMYQHPFYDTAHLTPLGRMMQGGPVAEAIASLLDTGDWKPVQIGSAVRSGVNIDLTYEGTVFDQGYSLAQDTDWVPSVANLGFAPYSTGGATLSSATITGKNTVRLTFSSAPNAGTVVAYATGVNNANTAWAFRLGNLMVQTARQDLFHSMGFAVPQLVRHYAIRQEITVA